MNSVHPAFSKGSVLLFIIALASTVLLVIAGTGFAVYSNQHQVSAASQQWCDTLVLLTQNPVPEPADPKANPSREFSYQLYVKFRALEHKFGCR